MSDLDQLNPIPEAEKPEGEAAPAERAVPLADPVPVAEPIPVAEVTPPSEEPDTAAPAEEPALCTCEIETADGNTFTVGIGENYFLVNGVGYYMGAYETLRDWTLALLE